MGKRKKKKKEGTRKALWVTKRETFTNSFAGWWYVSSYKRWKSRAQPLSGGL